MVEREKTENRSNSKNMRKDLIISLEKKQVGYKQQDGISLNNSHSIYCSNSKSFNESNLNYNLNYNIHHTKSKIPNNIQFINFKLNNDYFNPTQNLIQAQTQTQKQEMHVLPNALQSTHQQYLSQSAKENYKKKKQRKFSTKEEENNSSIVLDAEIGSNKQSIILSDSKKQSNKIKMKKKAFNDVDRSIEKQKDPKYKSELCKTFELKGLCPYGNLCRFAHGKDDLIPENKEAAFNGKYKIKLCNSFTKNGYCNYGSRCNFKHEKREMKDVSRLYYVLLIQTKEYKDSLYRNLEIMNSYPASQTQENFHTNNNLEFNQNREMDLEISSKISLNHITSNDYNELKEKKLKNKIVKDYNSSTSCSSEKKTTLKNIFDDEAIKEIDLQKKFRTTTNKQNKCRELSLVFH